jgi:hypothetical protein
MSMLLHGVIPAGKISCFREGIKEDNATDEAATLASYLIGLFGRVFVVVSIGL